MRLIAITASLILATAAASRQGPVAGSQPLLAPGVRRPASAVVQIKLGDLLELVPRKSSPEQKEILARLTAIEARLSAIEAKLGVPVPGALARGGRPR